MSFLYWEQAKTRRGLKCIEDMGITSSLDQLLMLQFNTAQDAVGHLCSKGMILSHIQLAIYQSPEVLSAELLPRQSDPSINYGTELVFPRLGTSYLHLLNFVRFLLAHPSSTSWSFGWQHCPTSPQSGVIYTLDRVHSVVFSR